MDQGDVVLAHGVQLCGLAPPGPGGSLTGGRFSRDRDDHGLGDDRLRAAGREHYTAGALTDRLWFPSQSGRAGQSWQKLLGEFLRDVPEQ
jgi:hypothetical protein